MDNDGPDFPVGALMALLFVLALFKLMEMTTECEGMERMERAVCQDTQNRLALSGGGEAAGECSSAEGC